MTERMQAIAEAVGRWGTHAAAAKNLGISTGTVTATMQRVEVQQLRERVLLAGHRTTDDHDCFIMDCAHLGPEVEMLRSMLRERDTQAENRRVVNETDRALLAEIAERTDAYQRWLKDDGPNPDDLWQAVDDRRELLRIVREQEARNAILETVLAAAERLAYGIPGAVPEDGMDVPDEDVSVSLRRNREAARAVIAAIEPTLPTAADVLGILADRPTAEDQADDAAAERATAGKWGGS